MRPHSIPQTHPSLVSWFPQQHPLTTNAKRLRPTSHSYLYRGWSGPRAHQQQTTSFQQQEQQPWCRDWLCTRKNRRRCKRARSLTAVRAPSMLRSLLPPRSRGRHCRNRNSVGTGWRPRRREAVRLRDRCHTHTHTHTHTQTILYQVYVV